MKLRLNNLLMYKLKLNKIILIFLLSLFYCQLFSQKALSLNEVKNEANRYFEDGEFTKAYKPYTQLVANYPKEPEYNYRLGVCMIYCEPDKKKCISYLKTASKNSEESPKDVKFYLGKAYHINYLFDEAIKCYSEYKLIGTSVQQKKLQVDQEIKACENGKRLLSNMTDLVVQSKKQLNELDYFRSYDLKSIGGKLLIKPDEFKTSADKKKKEKSILFLPKGSNTIYYSSYGDNPLDGKDIYTSTKQADNSYSKGEKVSGINTEFDEDYPFLHPDGKTLYFASKGFNSMGGYDIFKSVYDEENKIWGKPKNMEFPINSPDDDFLFVTDSAETTAYFSTGRQSPPGKIDVLKINTKRIPIDVLVIKGNLFKESKDQVLNGKIFIKNIETQDSIGTFKTSDSGDYLIDLPNGAKLLFTVETPGLKTQSDTVNLPLATTSKPYRQTISYLEDKLVITNFFDENSSDDNYIQYLKVIEKKAKLDVNESTKVVDETIVNNPKKEVEENSKVIETKIEKKKSENPSVSNRELVLLSKQDAEEARKEYKELKQDAEEAKQIGNELIVTAESTISKMNELIISDETIDNIGIRNDSIKLHENKRNDALKQKEMANKLLTYSEALTKDSKIKEKEAELNEQYSNELEKINTQNTDYIITKLEKLQKEISEISSKEKTSENFYADVKDKIEEKENSLSSIEKINNLTEQNLTEVKQSIAENESILSKTRKKSIKAELNQKIEDLKAEEIVLEKELSNNEAEIIKLNTELVDKRNELELSVKIKSENIALTITTQTVSDQAPIVNNITDNQAVTTQTVSDQSPIVNNLSDNQAVTTQTISENITTNKENEKEGDSIIENNKNQEPIKDKEEISINNKQLENIPKNEKIEENTNQNSLFITANSNNTKELNKNLEELTRKLSIIDSDNDNLNNYQNEKAIQLKTDADKTISESKFKQNILKELIIKSKATIDSLMSNPNIELNYETNQDNIKSLIAENKSNEFETNEAKILNNEADSLYREIQVLKDDVKLESDSSAIETLTKRIKENENEIIIKQNETIAVLQKSNSEYQLIKSPDSTFSIINNIIQEINKNTNELLSLRINGYQKQIEANTEEMNQLNLNIKTNEILINKKTNIKNKYTSINTKIDLINKQIDEIKLNTSQESTLDSILNIIKTQKIAITELLNINDSIKELNNTNIKITKNNINKPNVEKNNIPAEKIEAKKESDNITMKTDKTSITIKKLNEKDTTSEQLIVLFNSADNNNEVLNESGQTSINELNVLLAESILLKKQLNSNSNKVIYNPREYLYKSDSLNLIFDSLIKLSNNLRVEAEEKDENEKQPLIAKSNELDSLALLIKIEVTKYYDLAKDTLSLAINDSIQNKLEINKESQITAIINLINALNIQFDISKNLIPYNLSSELNAQKEFATNLNKESKQILESLKNITDNELKLKQLTLSAKLSNQAIIELNELLPFIKKTIPNNNIAVNTQKIEALPKQESKEEIKKEKIIQKKESISIEGLEIKNETAYNNDNPIPLNAKLNDGLLYRVQIGAFKMLIANNSFNGLSPINAEKTGNGYYRYTAGNYSEYNTANTVKNELRKIGYRDAYVVFYYNGKRISRSESISLSKTNENTEIVANQTTSLIVNTPEIKKEINKINGLLFTIQIGLYNKQINGESILNLKPIYSDMAPNGLYRYTAGIYNNIDKILKDRKRVADEIGIKDAFISAYLNGKRISFNEAKERQKNDLNIKMEDEKPIEFPSQIQNNLSINNESQNSISTVTNNIKPFTNNVNSYPNPTIENGVKLNEDGYSFKVQIGAFRKQVPNEIVAKYLTIKIWPVEYKVINSLFIYNIGNFTEAKNAETLKNEAIRLGIADAFITVYKDGKKVYGAEATNMLIR